MRVVRAVVIVVALIGVYIWAEPLVLEPNRATTEALVGADAQLIGYYSTMPGGRARSVWQDFWRWSPEQVVPRPPPPAAQWNYHLDLPDGYAPPPPFECIDKEPGGLRDVFECHATIDGVVYRVVFTEDWGSASVVIPQE